MKSGKLIFHNYSRYIYYFINRLFIILFPSLEAYAASDTASSSEEMAWDPVPLVENKEQSWTEMEKEKIHHHAQHGPTSIIPHTMVQAQHGRIPVPHTMVPPGMAPSEYAPSEYTDHQLMPPPLSMAPPGGKHHYVPHPLYQTRHTIIPANPKATSLKGPQTYRGKVNRTVYPKTHMHISDIIPHWMTEPKIV